MKSIFSIILLCCTISLFSQQTTSTPVLSKSDYLKKSKNQKKIAWILLGGGGALVLTGIIIPKGEITHQGFLGNDYKNDGKKSAFKSTGALLMLGSIPLFLASSKNKKKGMSVSFKNETVPNIYRQSIVSLPLPSLALKISLRK